MIETREYKLILKILQGTFIGLAMILPGLSAGTVILILGFYRQFLDDLASLRIRPYLPMIGGALAGALLGVYTISFLLLRFETVVMAFLLGMLLASIPTVINYHKDQTILPWPILLGISGFALSWFVFCEPSNTFTVLPPGGLFHFFIGGTLASAAMLLPGVSGSSVLIIMNLYDDAIFAITNWQWAKLVALAAGFTVGLFGLARLLSALYRRYQTAISFTLAGLILGSTRALLPTHFSFMLIIAAACGALVVFLITRKR